ncbi:hypothetical protein Tco_1137339 [Tanacetum coccineum]
MKGSISRKRRAKRPYLQKRLRRSEVRKEELVDLLGPEVVNKYYNDKLHNDSDDETHLTGSMVESSKAKKIKKFDFVTKGGKHIHLTEEEINHQKKIEEEAKAKADKHESEVRKEELVDLLVLEVVNK